MLAVVMWPGPTVIAPLETLRIWPISPVGASRNPPTVKRAPPVVTSTTLPLEPPTARSPVSSVCVMIEESRSLSSTGATAAVPLPAAAVSPRTGSTKSMLPA